LQAIFAAAGVAASAIVPRLRARLSLALIVSRSFEAGNVLSRQEIALIRWDLLRRRAIVGSLLSHFAVSPVSNFPQIGSNSGRAFVEQRRNVAARRRFRLG
jgi:hypothetical protein